MVTPVHLNAAHVATTRNHITVNMAPEDQWLRQSLMKNRGRYIKIENKNNLCQINFLYSLTVMWVLPKINTPYME